MNWKDILKGEEIHPSVRGFQEKGKSKFRSEMIKLKQRLTKVEEEFKTKEVQDNKYIKERLADKIDTIKRQIERLSKETGASFGSATNKDPLTGKEYKYSIAQRLSPSTKKPKVERMKRPFAYSYDPNEKDMDKILMRRYGFSEEQYKELSPEVRQDLMNVYEITKD